MSARIDQRAEARRDLVNHFVFLGQHNLRTAQRFLKAAERALAQLARMPGLAARARKSADVGR